ncbi:MAG: acyltransferase [Gammaproteobacteria bacterium]|nr:acyltransferase [Gammaproteobacteria bacterium]
MFGYLRFFLASLVLLSHVDLSVQGANPGVAAVVVFYMLAGFVVCNLFSKVFVADKPLFFQFYYERFLRIFPLYLFVLALTILFLFTTNFGSPKFEFSAMLSNMLIVPLNYFMILDNTILQEPNWWLIPPAWSLGVELQAYLLLPFIIYYRNIKIVLGLISLCIFCAACFGVIHTNYFGYRLLPGVFFIFILGVCIYNTASEKRDADIFDKYFPSFVYIMLILMLIVLGIFRKLLEVYVVETIIGLLVGIPVISFLARIRKNIPLNHVLGDLSYGIFLSHFLAIWMVEHFLLVDRLANGYLYIVVVFSISLLISLLAVFLIEVNIKKYRFYLSKSIQRIGSVETRSA